MGTDIHGFWEVKDHTGHWMAFDEINSGRNYMWFGMIAGVRGGPDIGTAHRGTPKNISGAYKDLLDEWGSDLHSHTWLTRVEVQEACKEYERQCTEAYNECVTSPYEDVPNLDSKVHQLIVGWGKNDDHIAWDWWGLIKDLMHPDGDIDTHVRMVVCFDS